MKQSYLGAIIFNSFPQVKLWLSAASSAQTHAALSHWGSRLQSLSPSLEMYKINIENAGLSEVIETIKN
jgi:hypothetical protein